MNLQITPKTEYPILQKIHTRNPIRCDNYTGFAPKDEYSFGSSNFDFQYKPGSGILESIKFNKPMEVSKAFLEMSAINDENIIYNMIRKTHTMQQLEELGKVLASKAIGDTKVVSLLGFGAFAFAFETTDGEILKITETNHFPNGRNPAAFDLPIKKSGRFSKYPSYYYYIEEKVSQDNITQQELRVFINDIKSLGYRMKDYLVHYDETFGVDIKTEQFGRAKDGKIYLIDPGCAIETDEVYNSSKKYNLKAIFKRLLKK